MTEIIIPFDKDETRMSKGRGSFYADAVGLKTKEDTIYIFNRSAKNGVTTIGHVAIPNDIKIIAELRNELTRIVEEKL